MVSNISYFRKIKTSLAYYNDCEMDLANLTSGIGQNIVRFVGSLAVESLQPRIVLSRCRKFPTRVSYCLFDFKSGHVYQRHIKYIFLSTL